MKTCKRCLREYDALIPLDDDPAQELSALFLEVTDPEEEDDFCPHCRKEAEILSLLGLGQ